MKISEKMDYAAPPGQVFTMVCDQEFQDRKCLATGAVDHSVSIITRGDRTAIATERSMPAEGLDLPSFINVGPTLQVTETQDWGPEAADGSRQGTFTVSLKGLPLALRGTLSLAPTGSGTVETVSGDLKANVPLIGGKIEKTAAPAIIAAIRVERDTGQAWLAG